MREAEYYMLYFHQGLGSKQVPFVHVHTVGSFPACAFQTIFHQ